MKISTGLVGLDDLLGGGLPHGVTVVTGAHGTGVSTVGQHLAMTVGKDAEVLWVTAASDAQVIVRLLRAEAGFALPEGDPEDWALNDAQWERVAGAARRIRSLRITGVDASSATVRRLTEVVDRRHPALVVIDGTALTGADGVKVAAAGGCPVVLLAHGDPQDEALSDLAAAVVWLHRPDLHDPMAARAGELDLVVLRHPGEASPIGVHTVALRAHRIAEFPTAA